MSELESAIKKLTVRPPQRSINNNMRDILRSIARIYAKILAEHTGVKEIRRNTLLNTKTSETTPNSPHDENQPKRWTPPKGNKTTHEEAPGNEIVNHK